VDYIESQDDYVIIHAGGRRWRKKQTLTSLEALLDKGRFVRIHRCHLLNLDRLERLESYAKDSRVAFLSNGARLPVSRAGYARLKRFL
jgi:two-component system LytT family response regulator